MIATIADASRMSDAWGIAEESDRRYRKLCVRLGAPVLAFALVVPWMHFQQQQSTPFPQLRRIELLPELPKLQPILKVEPAPIAPPPPLEKQKVVRRAAPASAPVIPVQMPSTGPSAREVAQAAGLVKLRDQLAAMNDRQLLAVDSSQTLISSARTIKGGASGESLATGAASTSGGVAGAGNAGVSGSGSAAGVGARRTGAVQSVSYPGRGIGLGGQGTARTAARGLEEIQLAFERSKSAFNAIFSRAMRETPGLSAGRVVVSLTIAPDGSVSRVELVSGGFNNAELEQKILQRVRLLNFGAKDVPSYTYANYPIDFLPS